MDTGAAVTLISEKHVPRNVTLIPPKSMVRSYAGQSLEIKGLYTAEVQYKWELFYLEVHVVRRSQQPNLLGRNWINCLKMKAVHIRNIETTPQELQALIEKHSALFKEDSGLNYTGPCARFEFKKDSNPRFFRARPVPYALCFSIKA